MYAVPLGFFPLGFFLGGETDFRNAGTQEGSPTSDRDTKDGS